MFSISRLELNSTLRLDSHICELNAALPASNLHDRLSLKLVHTGPEQSRSGLKGSSASLGGAGSGVNLG